MLITPYDTVMLSKYNMKNTYQEIDQAIVSNNVVKMRLDEEKGYDVYAIVEPTERIDPFYQPVYRELTGRRPAIVYDARPYKSSIVIDGDEAHLVRPNDSLKQLHTTAILMGIWAKDPSQIYAISEIPLLVYGSLLTETLGRKLGLDPESQLKAMITLQTFFLTRGYDNFNSWNYQDKQTLATMITRRLSLVGDYANKVIDTIEGEDLRDIITITEFIKKQQWSPRLSNLGAKDIFLMVQTAWVGQGDPKGTLLAALEYPPSWTAIVFIMAQGSFYQKMPIGQILKRLDRNANLANFNKSMYRLIGENALFNIK